MSFFCVFPQVCPALIGDRDSPAGWVDMDGTSWIMYTQRGNSSIISGRGAQGFGLAKARAWKGPYVPVTGYWDWPVLSTWGAVGPGPPKQGPVPGDPKYWAEGDVLYRDSRGAFHMVCH
jgi:hypothetical protein